jgi:IclR family mhp operon transcriptional activator
LTETTNTEIKTCIQRRHLAQAPPWSSSTGSSGRHASESMVAFTGMRNKVLTDVRARGCGTRDRDFGGHYDLPRSQANDGRNSIAVPVYAGDEVVGCINLTWIARVATVPVIIERFLPQLIEAARSISRRMTA